ncbi:MAG: tripartite tricarboxylate transporter substrate binding protein [Burkholderiaceae bacterium]
MNKWHTLAVSALVVIAPPAVGAYPEKPVTIVVPFAAGGGTDIIGRTVQGLLAKALGSDVVVKNTAGAGGTVGAAEVAKARPDGYTLGLLPVGPLTTQTNLRKLPYGIGSYEYICRLYSAPTVIAARKDAPYNNLKELFAWAQANPGKLNFAVPGIGSIPHVAGLSVAGAGNFKMEFLPLKGDAPSLKSLLDGTAQMFNPATGFFTANKEQLKALALLTDDRLGDMPGVATAKEQGYRIVLPIWGGLVAPKGTPAAAISKLEAACDKAVHSDAYKAHMVKLRQPVAYQNAAGFAAFVKEQFETNKQVLAKAGLKPK